MKQTLLTGIQSLLALANVPPRRPRIDAGGTEPRPGGRHVNMHINLDEQHATPLRQALIRDCGGQSWTIRLTRQPGSDRVRLSLHLPKTSVARTIKNVARLVPGAEVGQLVEIPNEPSSAWQALTKRDFAPPAAPGEGAGEQSADTQTIGSLLTAENVLLDLALPDRMTLFEQIGRFAAQHHGLIPETVVAELTAREAMGSTGLGQGVAVPHGRIDGLQQAIAIYVRPLNPVPFDSPDGKPVTDIVALLVPATAGDLHLRLLADVAQRFCDRRFRQSLHGCADQQGICDLFAGYVPPTPKS